MKNIDVTIFCLTYNHVDYIQKALDGFLSQIVDFEVRILIHDDCSTDGTAEIIERYKKRYPDKIVAIIEKTNKFSTNRNEIFEACKPFLEGEYIAVCEGDDYWIDRYKLKKQKEYMDKHRECSMCAHNAVESDTLKDEISLCFRSEEDLDISSEEMILRKSGHIPTASFFCRRELFMDYYFGKNRFFREVGIGDYPLQLFMMAKGEIHYIDRVMSVYRKNHTGSWSRSQRDDKLKRMHHITSIIRFFIKYNVYTKSIYEKCIFEAIQRYISIMLGGFIDENISEYYKACESEVIGYSEIRKLIGDIIKKHKDITEGTIIPDFLNRHNYNVIYGTGEYGQKMCTLIRERGLMINGCVVSDGQKGCNSIEGYKVWEMSEIPFPISETGVIIGVGREVEMNNSNILDSEVLFKEVLRPFSPEHTIEDILYPVEN